MVDAKAGFKIFWANSAVQHILEVSRFGNDDSRAGHFSWEWRPVYFYGTIFCSLLGINPLPALKRLRFEAKYSILSL